MHSTFIYFKITFFMSGPSLKHTQSLVLLFVLGSSSYLLLDGKVKFAATSFVAISNPLRMTGVPVLCSRLQLHFPKSRGPSWSFLSEKVGHRGDGRERRAPGTCTPWSPPVKMASEPDPLSSAHFALSANSHLYQVIVRSGNAFRGFS